MLAGAERFFVEFLRAKDDRLLWGATTTQAIAVVLLLVGLVLLRTWRERSAPGPAIPDDLTARQAAPEAA